MQFLQINKNTTLTDLSSEAGRQNVNEILITNSLPRVPKVGQAYTQLCNDIIAQSSPLTPSQKANLLNNLTSDSEVFETAALMSDNEWKVYNKLGTLPMSLAVPSTIVLQKSASIIGNSSSAVPSRVYQKTVESLRRTGHVDSTIFNSVSTIGAQPHENTSRRETRLHSSGGNTDLFSAFAIPWGEIQLYSSLTGEYVDIPAYPSGPNDGIKASYVQMPDLIYQYEPWFAYNSSGPRTVEYSFSLHRDMWTGDHRDGRALALINFCKACCYPNYNGSAVHTTTVTLYISGKSAISGILTEANVKWDDSSPIGLDGQYLAFTLTLSITEVSKVAKTLNSVRELNIMGG